MCVAVVGQFFMVLACVVQADCLSVNTSVPCELCCFKSLARGFINQTDISTEQETDDFCFVSFCFFNGTHGFATVRCLWLNAWVLFCFSSWWYVTLLRVCLSDWRKMLGSNGFFFSKTGQFNDTFAKTSPSEYLIWPLHFASAWCKLSPKLNGCDFLFLQFIVACVIYIETTFSICVWYILWGDQTRKRVFLRFRDTVFQSEERTEEEVWRHQEKSVNIFIELLLSFCAAKSYEFVSFIQKNNIT